MNRFCHIIACIFLVSKICLGQSLYFQSYTTREGLTQNSVYSITQSKDGFMWFGTQHGLNRFDGKKIVPIDFIKSTKDTTSEFSGMITAMYIDSRDNFWIGTTAEIFLFDRFTNRIFSAHEKYNELRISPISWVDYISEDNYGNLIIHTRKETYLYNLTSQSFLAINHDIKNKITSICVSSNLTYYATENEVYAYNGKIFSALNVQSFLSYKKINIKKILTIANELWMITSDNKVWISKLFNDIPGNWKSFEENYNGEALLIDPSILHKANENTIWIGSRSEGVLIVDIKTKIVKKSSNIYHPNALKKKFVLSLYTSNNNITWIGVSGGGVAKYDQNVTQFGLWRNESISGKAQTDNMILSIYSENDEDFYLGTINGGLLHTNIKSNESKYYVPPLGKYNKTETKNIYTITKDQKDLLWMATWGGLCSFDTKTKRMKLYNDSDGKTIELTTLIKIKNQNKLLVAGNKMGLRLYDINKNSWQPIFDPYNIISIKELRVRYLLQLNENEFLLCTENANLCKYNIQTGKFTFYPDFLKISGMSPHCYITSEYWWIGTNDGLIQADAKTQNIIEVWNKDKGLSDNVIYAVLPDDKGNIWIGTNQGLNAIDPKKGICKKYNENDGLQSMEFNTASCYKDKSGNLWFGGVDGFNKISVNVEQKVSYSPTPIITNIQVMNEILKSDTVISYLKNVVLNHKSNFIVFEFQAPNFSQPENIVYKYRMLGLDTTWIYSGNRNYVNYTQLQPGKYSFEVKSANTNLMWSDDSAKIHITILSPWYKTWWFYLISAVVILLLLRYFYLQRIVKVRTETALQNKMYETEMAALKAQMNPHFIFNCINSIDAFIQSNDKYNASMYLNKFAKLIRNILDNSKNNLVPFEKDIETIKIYIELEEMRNDNKFKTEYNIDESLYIYDIKIPPLIIQPFVENAIIHGLRNKESNDGILSITVVKEEDVIRYSIRDNGIGRKAAANISRKKELSYGMQLSADRVRLYNEDDADHVKITDLYDGDNPIGTLIEVKLKIS